MQRFISFRSRSLVWIFEKAFNSNCRFYFWAPSRGFVLNIIQRSGFNFPWAYKRRDFSLSYTFLHFTVSIPPYSFFPCSDKLSSLSVFSPFELSLWRTNSGVVAATILWSSFTSFFLSYQPGMLLFHHLHSFFFLLRILQTFPFLNIV